LVVTEMPVLVTDRLRLRPLRKDDLERFAELASAPEVYATTLNLPRPYTVECARDFIKFQRDAWAEGVGLQLMIAERESDQPVGTLGLNIERRMDRGELGYWVGVPYWNRGYATEASSAIAGYGFEHLGLVRIWAGHFVGNEASGRVQQKIGMKREGLLRQHYKKDGAYLDDVLYAVLKDEFTPVSAWQIESES
jgi:RimJ/RimL family protein N-acetyltransferase